MHKLSHKELTQDDIDMYWYYKKNGGRKAFFLRYFEFLKISRTNTEAFYSANNEYFELFGEYKYSSIPSFLNSLKKYLAE